MYGALLSKRQRDAMRLHFEEDLSYAEAAKRLRVTRQCVHNYVKTGLNEISNYEELLGLVSRHKKNLRKLLAVAAKISSPVHSREIVRIAEAL